MFNVRIFTPYGNIFYVQHLKINRSNQIKYLDISVIHLRLYIRRIFNNDE